MIQLFELCSADRDVRMSPFVWRVILGLKHKGLEFGRTPLMFLEKEAIAPANSKTVPVIKDGDTWVKDSFDIIVYLDEKYPEKSLITDLHAARFFNSWVNRTITMGLFPMLVGDLVAGFDEKNAAYFRESRQRLFGDKSMEEVSANRDAMVPKFIKSLAPIKDQLRKQPFLCGNAPGWMDYAVVANFIWAESAKGFDTLAGADLLSSWRARMYELHDGFIRKELNL